MSAANDTLASTAAAAAAAPGDAVDVPSSSTYVRAMAPLLFLLCWLGLAFPSRWGRTLCTLAVALAAIALGVISPAAAFAAINLPTIVLLLGGMIQSAMLGREGFFVRLEKIAVLGLHSSPHAGSWMIARVCLASGVLSALFTNDTWVVVSTPMVCALCKRFHLPYLPFLLALATSSNIGSATSPMGNPQNMIVSLKSGIGFLGFLEYLLLPTLVAMALNIIAITWIFKRQLADKAIIWTQAEFERMESTGEQEGREEEARGAADDNDGAAASPRLHLQGIVVAPVLASSQDDQKESGESQSLLQSAIRRPRNNNNDDAAFGLEMMERRIEGDETNNGVSAASSAPCIGTGSDQNMFLATTTDESAAAGGSPNEHPSDVTNGLIQRRSPDNPPSSLGGGAANATFPSLGSASSAAFLPRDFGLDSPPRIAANAGLGQSSASRGLPSAYPDLDLSQEWCRAEYIRRAQLDFFYARSSAVLSNGDDRGSSPSPPLPDADHGKDGSPLPPPRPVWSTETDPRYAAPPLNIQSSAAFNARARANGLQVSSPPASASAAASAAPAASPAAASTDGRLCMVLPRYTSLSTPITGPAAPRCGPLGAWLESRGCYPRPSKLMQFTFVLFATLIGFLAGLPLALCALGGGVCMLLLDEVDPDLPGGVWVHIDWALLVFFAALFVVVESLSLSGWPQDCWAKAGPYLSVESAGGVALYALLVVLGSNTVSNVPLVLILAPSISALPSRSLAHHSWLLLAFVSTLAGNLTLVGSVANLIVQSRARPWFRMEFVPYAKYGVWTTALFIFIGVLIIQAEMDA